MDGVKQSAKGVQRSVKESLHHAKYRSCLFQKTSQRAPMTPIYSENHQISMTNKVALNCFVEKRFILSDGITTMPHGNFRLEQNPGDEDNESF